MNRREYPALPSRLSRHDLGVLDGDTLDLQLSVGLGVFVERRVRLLGVNCPEIRKKSSAKEGSRFKKLTFAFVDYATRESSQHLVVRTEQNERHDSFGRLLADVYRMFLDADGYVVEQESLAEFLLKNGAPVYIGIAATDRLMGYGRGPNVST